MNFKDVPDDKKKTFCGCYEGLIRTKVTYADWVLLSLALQTKGPDQLDGDETRTFDAARSAWFACGGGPAAK
jgi:hypothetical protein